MIEYIIPVVVVVILLYGIYYTITTKNKLGGGGIITGNVLLEQFDNEDKRRAKAEIRYQKEIKKQDGEQGEGFPSNPSQEHTLSK